MGVFGLDAIEIDDWELVDVSWSKLTPSTHKLHHRCGEHSLSLASWNLHTDKWYCVYCKVDAPRKMQFIAHLMGGVDKRF